MGTNGGAAVATVNGTTAFIRVHRAGHDKTRLAGLHKWSLVVNDQEIELPGVTSITVIERAGEPARVLIDTFWSVEYVEAD